VAALSQAGNKFHIPYNRENTLRFLGQAEMDYKQYKPVWF